METVYHTLLSYTKKSLKPDTFFVYRVFCFLFFFKKKDISLNFILNQLFDVL